MSSENPEEKLNERNNEAPNSWLEDKAKPRVEFTEEELAMLDEEEEDDYMRGRK